MQDQYTVSFTGQVIPGFDVDAVKRDVQQKLKVPAEQIPAFFSGKTIPLKKHLSMNDALTLKNRLENLGLMMEMSSESMMNLSFDVPEPPPKLEPSPVTTEKDPYDYQRIERMQADIERKQSLAPQRIDRYEDGQDAVPEFFSLSFDGRYGRLNFINAWVIFYGVLMLAMVVSMLFLPTLFILVLLVLTMIASIRIMVLRLHDINLSGWWVIFYFIPALNVAFLLFVMLMPGSSEENEYGRPVPQGPWYGVLILLALLLLGGLFNEPLRQAAERQSTTQTRYYR